MKEPRNARLVVLISGHGTNLQALLDARDQGRLPADISLVISNRQEANGLERARRSGIPTLVHAHTNFRSRDAYDAALAQAIDACEPDLVVLAGFMRILGNAFVEHYQGRLINIHPSLLPEFRGLHTHRRVLEAGCREHGCSVHFVTTAVDAGPVIVQSRIAVRPDDTEVTLVRRVQQQEHRIYPLAVRWFVQRCLCLRNERAWLDGRPLATPVVINADSPLPD